MRPLEGPEVAGRRGVMQEIGQFGAEPSRRRGKLPVLIWGESPDGAGEQRWISA